MPQRWIPTMWRQPFNISSWLEHLWRTITLWYFTILWCRFPTETFPKTLRCLCKLILKATRLSLSKLAPTHHWPESLPRKTCLLSQVRLIAQFVSFSTKPCVIAGHGKIVNVGEKVLVTCKDPVKIFTKDTWDGDDTDNKLHVICRPDGNFDVPSAKNLPICLAQCAAEKPTPSEDYNIEIDSNKTSLTDKLWEREELWYRCTRRQDGIAVPGPTGEYEGSDVSFIKYVCNEKGNYSLPLDENGKYILPKCVKRRKLRHYFLNKSFTTIILAKRCQCLGDFKKTSYATDALNLYCRNDTYQVLPGLSLDPNTKQPLEQVVPSKTRCGSLDPVELTLENKCHCLPKDGLGSSRCNFF